MNSAGALRPGCLFEAAFPRLDWLTKFFLVISCSWLMALASRLSLPLPLTPVPVTAQTLAVLLLAALLGKRTALAVQGAYLAQGLIGLPVFSPGITWGIARLLSPTGGYLIGFLLTTWIVGGLADRGFGKHFFSAMAIMASGELGMFGIALPWLKFSMHVDWAKAAQLGLWPFLMGDAYKIVLAAMLLPLGWKVLRKVNENSESD
ncbi:MAG: biotin transporter BioY [Acidobacteriia bacterium]|nr:biotin transporter BioY [Terriglobia bacterium]